MAGARVKLGLEVQHFPAGSQSASHAAAYGYEGLLTSEGTFDLARTSWATVEGERVERLHRRAYDGRVLVYANEGAELQSAYAPGKSAVELMWQTQLRPHLKPLYWWLTNPFGISRFPEHEYERTEVGAMT